MEITNTTETKTTSPAAPEPQAQPAASSETDPIRDVVLEALAAEGAADERD